MLHFILDLIVPGVSIKRRAENQRVKRQVQTEAQVAADSQCLRMIG